MGFAEAAPAQMAIPECAKGIIPDELLDGVVHELDLQAKFSHLFPERIVFSEKIGQRPDSPESLGHGAAEQH